LGFRYLAEDAAALLREISLTMNFVELDAGETLKALDTAQQRGVRGRTRDWLHARGAAKARVAELLADNVGDFAGLEDGFKIPAP
jgi:hypothetical protein